MPILKFLLFSLLLPGAVRAADQAKPVVVFQPSHQTDTGEMIDHIIGLVEKKAASLEAEKALEKAAAE